MTCIFLYSALRERAVVEGIKPTTEKTHRGNPIKRAKWHLGIRSQSKPQDIMNEVYRAMKTLNFVSPAIIHSITHVVHCSWKLRMDGWKNAETSSMDFYTQLVTLKGWKKQFENLWADFWEKRKIWFRKSEPKIHHISKISCRIFKPLVLGFMVS